MDGKQGYVLTRRGLLPVRLFRSAGSASVAQEQVHWADQAQERARPSERLILPRHLGKKKIIALRRWKEWLDDAGLSSADSYTAAQGSPART